MIEVVSGIIEDNQGRVLIAQRPPGKKLAGKWEFPGGKVEAGETPEDALVRELEEELHLEIEIGFYMGSFLYDYEWGAIKLHVFTVTALNEPKASPDVQVFQWLKPSEIDTQILAAADIEPLAQYLKRLESGPQER